MNVIEMKSTEETVSRQRDNAPSWYSPAEAAAIAGVDKSTVVRWCQRIGTPLARRVRGRWRVSPQSLARLLDGQELDSAASRRRAG